MGKAFFYKEYFDEKVVEVGMIKILEKKLRDEEEEVIVGRVRSYKMIFEEKVVKDLEV